MKTVNNNKLNAIIEKVKRTVYSFQVLIIGVAIPVLFVIGISNINQKNTNENQVKEINSTSDMPSKAMVDYFIPKI